MKKLIYIILAVGTLTFVSCEKTIDFDLNDQENSRLVVEGNITDQMKVHTVKLTRTSSYYENQPAPTETGATVTISDGTTTHTLTESAPGIYVTAPTYQGVIGKTYTLNIITSNNDIYTASSTLQSVAPIDTVLTSVEEKTAEDPPHDKEWTMILHHFGPEPAGVGNNYMWLVDINGVNYTKSVTDVMFVKDEFVDGNYIAGFEFQDINFNQLPTVDSLRISVEMHSISRAYHDFLFAIVLETEYNGDLFSGPPANIPSNISNGGLGFFRASAVSSMYFEIENPAK